MAQQLFWIPKEESFDYKSPEKTSRWLVSSKELAKRITIETGVSKTSLSHIDIDSSTKTIYKQFERLSDMFAPLIVGLPRTGFSLTASVLIHIFNLVPNKFGTEQTIRYFCETVKLFEVNLYRSAALQCSDDLLLNDILPTLQWADLEQRCTRTKAYFRKYIGIKGYGDFTLLTAIQLNY